MHRVSRGRFGLGAGAGGTQRLPRLVGLGEALRLVPTGKTINGWQAKNIGLIDEVDDDPQGFAAMIDGERLGNGGSGWQIKRW